MQDKTEITEATQLSDTRAPWEEEEEEEKDKKEEDKKSEKSEKSENVDKEGEKEESDELVSLRAEVERLRAELAEAQSANERVSADIEEFHRLFPTVDLADLPSEVTDGVRSGIPLSASYALYERRIEAERERAEAVNRKNARHSSGAAGKNTAREYFTPDEVRAMSQSEVRDNYTKIVASMKRWNR